MYVDYCKWFFNPTHNRPQNTAQRSAKLDNQYYSIMLFVQVHRPLSEWIPWAERWRKREENGLRKVRPCLVTSHWPHLTEVQTGTGLSRASCDRWSLLQWKADGQLAQADPSFQAKVTMKELLKLSTPDRGRINTDRAPGSCSLAGFTARLVG